MRFGKPITKAAFFFCAFLLFFGTGVWGPNPSGVTCAQALTISVSTEMALHNNYLFWRRSKKPRHEQPASGENQQDEALNCQEGPSLPPNPYRARVAIIIDDIGTPCCYMDEVLAIQEPLTWAILPWEPQSSHWAGEALRHNAEVMLHLPLEPVNSHENPGPGLISRESSSEQIAQKLADDLNNVPGAVGVNNHMGSAATKDRRLMNVIMAELKKRNLFFIDSYTIKDTVVEKCARANQVPCGRRNIFIDHEESYQSKIEALNSLLEIALQHGSAIGIGHARKGTGEAIAAMLPKFKAAGVVVVPASELTN